MEREACDWIPRGEPRRPAKWAAAAQWPDGSRANVLVTNLSYQGCRLVSDRQFTKGETVRLFMPSLGQVHAQVRWVRNGIAGTKFITGDSSKDARRARVGV